MLQRRVVAAPSVVATRSALIGSLTLVLALLALVAFSAGAPVAFTVVLALAAVAIRPALRLSRR